MVVIKLIKESIMNTYPVKFFGIELNRIKTEADALRALDYFIRNADDGEVDAACGELENLVSNPVREVIRGLLWKLEYPLDSREWLNCFNLKYASA